MPPPPGIHRAGLSVAECLAVRRFITLPVNRFFPLFFASLAVAAFVLADDTHWTAHYKRFGGVRPAAQFEQVSRELFERTVIRDVILEASSLQNAIPKIRMLAQEAGAKSDISFIITDSTYGGYSKPLSLKAKNLTLAGLIDELALQGDFYWDFSATKLTMRPTKKP